MYNNINNKNDKNNTISSKISITHPYGKSQELSRIIGLEGTMKILYLIEEEARRYKDLDITLEKLSQTSLSRRLKRLRSLNVIKQKPIRSKKRDTHEYILTLRGEKLMTFFQEYEKEITLPSEQQKITEINTNSS